MKAIQSQSRETKRSNIFLFRRGLLASAARRGLAGILALSTLGLSTGAVWAQQAPPPPPDYDTGQVADQGPDSGPPPNAYQALGQEQLNDLVAPIALYPDSLVAQVLAASTYPQQVVAAEQFVQQSQNYPPSQLGELANEQPWDPSVKSLVAFPQVLGDLTQNMTWTTDLGNAYYNQPQDVMGAVQAMRQRAYAAGTLRTNPHLAVAYDPGDIVITPVSPEVVYVPYYNPWAVYGAPVPVYAHYHWGPPAGVVFGAGLAIGFGVGFAIGAFGHYGWGYHNWAPNWGARTVVYNNTTFISRSTTVVNHGYYGRFDRNPRAVAFNRGESARFSQNRTVNNVTINRGGNTYNRGGNTYNRGGNTYNRGGNTYDRGGNTYNRGGNTYDRGGNSYNRGGETYNRGANAANQRGDSFTHGGQSTTPGNAYNRGGQGSSQMGTYNRGAQSYNTRQGSQATQQPRQGAYNGRSSYQGTQQYNRGAYNTRSPQNTARPQMQSRPQVQQHSDNRAAPRAGGGGHDNHGGHR